MTDSRRVRRNAIFTAVLAVLLALVPSEAQPRAAAASEPAGIEALMKALGTVESSNNYKARNPSSGAYGKYQIMPSSWRGWARLYLGNSRAPQSPANQEYVARRKLIDLHRWLRSWPAVAHWWLTGDGSTNRASWSAYSSRYVDKVMTLYERFRGAARQPDPARSTPTWIKLRETHGKLIFRRGWAHASHAGYWGGTARYASRGGARLSFTFSGTGFQWIGPKGPTRGKARVYVNGELAGWVDLYAPRFTPRAVVFARTYARSTRREVVIVVSGTRGRPTVAVNAIYLRK